MSKVFNVSICIVSVSLLFSLSAIAIEVRGVNFADELTVDGKKLLLNGTAVRTATIFQVGVYAAALYTPEKVEVSDGSVILEDKRPRSLQMSFLRSVDADKIRETWTESFDKNCSADCAKGKTYLEQLKKAVPSMKEGERMTFTFTQEGVEAQLANEKRLKIGDRAFAKALLSTWIGKEPPSEEFRAGLLGSKKNS